MQHVPVYPGIKREDCESQKYRYAFNPRLPEQSAARSVAYGQHHMASRDLNSTIRVATIPHQCRYCEMACSEIVSVSTITLGARVNNKIIVCYNFNQRYTSFKRFLAI